MADGLLMESGVWASRCERRSQDIGICVLVLRRVQSV